MSRSISERTVSTANSGKPCAWLVTAARAVAGIGDQDQPRHPPVRRGVEQFLDRAQLRVPPGQRRLQPVHPLDTAHRRQHPGGPP